MSTKFKVGQLVHLKEDVRMRQNGLRQGRRPPPLPLYRIYEHTSVCLPWHPEPLGIYRLEMINFKGDATRTGCQSSDTCMEECCLTRVFAEKMRRKWRSA